MFLKGALIYFFIAFAKCDTQEPRNPKIFSFDTTNEDLEVGLDFSLPFIKIPIKTSEHGSPYAHDLTLPKINVNLSSLIVGGLVFLVTTFISPLLTKSFGHSHHRFSRVSDESEFLYNPLMEFSNQILTKNNGCLQRIACLSTQQTQDINSLRTMKQIMRNELLSMILNTTALEEATNNGLQGNDCLSYAPCALSKEDFTKIIENIATVINSRNSVKFKNP